MSDNDQTLRLPKFRDRHPFTFSFIIPMTTAPLLPFVILYGAYLMPASHAYARKDATMELSMMVIFTLCAVLLAGCSARLRGLPWQSSTPMESPDILVEEWQSVLAKRVNVSDDNLEIKRFLYETAQSLLDGFPSICELNPSEQRRIFQERVEHRLNRDALERFVRAEEAMEERQRDTRAGPCDDHRPSIGSATF